MDTLCSAPMFTVFLVGAGGLIVVAILSGREEQPPLRLFPKAELDKLIAMRFSQQHDSPNKEAFAPTRAGGAGDLWRGRELPSSNRASRRYAWHELSASCDADYANKFDGVENSIRLF
jgi:hypothetical protein